MCAATGKGTNNTAAALVLRLGASLPSWIFFDAGADQASIGQRSYGIVVIRRVMVDVPDGTRMRTFSMTFILWFTGAKMSSQSPLQSN